MFRGSLIDKVDNADEYNWGVLDIENLKLHISLACGINYYSQWL